MLKPSRVDLREDCKANSEATFYKATRATTFIYKQYLPSILKRFQHSFFVHYRVYVQALVHEQETRNLTLLNFLFLVRELVLVNPDNAFQECCNP